MKRFFVFWLGLGLMSLACSITSSDSENAATPTAVVEFPTPTVHAGNTLEDRALCYAFDYPIDWQISGAEGQAWSIANYFGEGRGGLNADQTKIDFVPFMASSLDQAAIGSNSETSLQDEPRITLPNGIEGIRTQQTDANFGMTFELLLIYIGNNAALGVTGLQTDAATFDSIVNTLRILENCP